jgi:hypothetical protein
MVVIVGESWSEILTLDELEANGTVSRAEANSRRLTAINARFAELDQARARPLAAYALGRQTPADTARLTEIEDEAARLRARLAELRAEEIKP